MASRLEEYLTRIARQIEHPPTLRVGFLENAKYPDGTPVAMVAAIHNYGAPRARIPARPFFSNMIADKQGEWPAAIAGLVKSTNYNFVRALDVAGAAISGQLKQSIIATNAPPLRPVTLMLRKMQSEDPDLIVTAKTVGQAARRVAAGESTAGVSTKPLIWSSHMVNSVDHEVVTT